MILEAFSRILHDRWHQTERPARTVLHEWLQEIIRHPGMPRNNVERVIRTELAMIRANRRRYFVGRSPSGQILLDSLYDYCESYERWQFRRWLHHVKPQAFNPPPR